MLIKFYEKYIKSRFINKMFVMYTLAIIITLTLLALAIYSNFSSTIRSDAIMLNSQVLKSVESYFVLKQNIINISYQQLYVDKVIYGDIIHFLENDISQDSVDYYTHFSKLEKYLKWISSLDTDILNITITRNIDGKVFNYVAQYGLKNVEQDIYSEDLNGATNDEFHGPQVIGAFTANTHGNMNEKMYSVCMNIWDQSITKNIGRIYINFSADCINKSFIQYKDKLKGYIIIMTKNGAVIYDSSGVYYNKAFLYFNEIQKPGQLKKLNEMCFVNMSTLNKLDIIVSGILPESELQKSTFTAKITIIVTIIASITLILLVFYTLSRIFSKRLRTVIGVIEKVQKGDLSNRIQIEGKGDELGIISYSFNQMCDKLSDYIEKEYISEINKKDAELKQKSAQLYSLQSQINPHFLYNTLEAIRMTAVADGNEYVGEMVHTLATLFRNSISTDMIVSIKDELDYCKSYLELFNLRYGQNLEITFDIDETVYEFGIFKYLVQPLIENSLVHGIDLNIEGNMILIKVFMNEGKFYISVTDNGKGISENRLLEINKMLEISKPAEGDSIGLCNINQRLKIVYGTEYGIHLESTEDIGTTVTINISAKTVKELRDHVQIDIS